MSVFVVACVAFLVAISPLLRRCYIDRFWAPVRGTVIRLDGGFSSEGG